MEMKKVLEQEGRDAKNLVAYLSVNNFEDSECYNNNYIHHQSRQMPKKPPLIPKSISSLHPIKKSVPRDAGKSSTGHRVRSASTGRDKKSELQARYWALLFGNLQRAINEIYQTVECYENMSSCQEAILVLENYIRDFRALAEWFRVSWDYEATPQPERPHSLAWEVRKSNPAPRTRAKSLSSPVVSGKTSPSYSGKSSPCPANEDAAGKTIAAAAGSPRKNFRFVDQQSKIREQLFASKTNLNEVRNAEICENKEQNSVIPEHPIASVEEMSWNEIIRLENHISPDVNINQTLDSDSVTKCDDFSQTDFKDDDLTLAEVRQRDEKLVLEQEEQRLCKEQAALAVQEPAEPKEPTSLELTVQKLNDMENAILAKDTIKSNQNVDSELKKIQPCVTSLASAAAKLTEQHPKKVQQSPIKYSSVLNRPAAASSSVVSAQRSATQRPTTTNTRASRPVSVVQSQSVQKSATTHFVTVGQAKRPAFQPMRSVTSANVNKPAGAVRNSSQLSTNVMSTNERWIPSNVANRLSLRSKTMIDMNEKNRLNPKIPNPVGNYSRKSSREDVCSSSSTLKASSERINSSKNGLNEIAASARGVSEPKQVNNADGVNNDGWLTVKTKRRTSLHWANRFNQPTGYASLPTLALLNEKDELNRNTKDGKKMVKEKEHKNKQKSEEKCKTEQHKPEVRITKAKVSSLTQQKNTQQRPSSASKLAKNTEHGADKTQALVLSPPNPCKVDAVRDGIIKRQKSDLTGLKLTSLHREYLRKYNKKEDCPAMNSTSAENLAVKDENDPIEDVTSATTAAVDDPDLNKIDIKIQTNREFSKTIGDLYESLASVGTNESRDVGLSSCDECEEKDDTESDEDQRKLFEEQESLERQIRELENTEIDVDTETDETDYETLVDMDENHEELSSEIGETSAFVDDENLSLEIRYQSLLSDMSWGERAETLATLQAFVSRHPGRAQELHQKLSSPSRRRSLHETLKKYQAKQARAQEKREALQKEKAVKIQQLLTRVECVKTAKQQLIDEKRLRMENKMQRATENRTQYLRDKIRKAHDEEEKLREIAFIKNIEAQNKRLDLIESCKETEGRLQDLEQERQKKVEEKAAKEAAVERRRQELEQARQRRLEKMNESRLEREQRIGKLQEQKEKQRQAQAREKDKMREERLLALQVQQQQTTKELQRKIIQKQRESARRHEENIEHIRQRALELTIPSRNVDENDHTANKDDCDANLELACDGGDLSSTVSDVSKEHSKASKKKFKKLKQRMRETTEEYMKELQPVPLHMKRESEIPKLLNLVSKGGGSQGLERPLGQILRIIAKTQISDFQCFWLMDGLGTISHVICDGIETNPKVSKRAVVIATQSYRNACSLCPQIARHAILGNSICSLFDMLVQSLQLPEEKSPQHPVELSTELMLACTVALSPANSLKHQAHPKILERLPDIISYAVSIGLIEILSRRCMKIRESIENHQNVVLSLLATLGLLTKFAELCPKGPTDPTRFLGAAKSTELFGTISLLYSSIVPIGECIPPRSISLAAATFNLLVSVAVLDLKTFQEVLSEENLCLKYLDVMTILLNYCSLQCSSNEKSETQAVIIDLVATIGFFCANNKKHQKLLTSEQSSIIIKSLTKLPEHFNMVIYPSLVTIIFDNDDAKQIIGRDFSIEFLNEYKNSELAKKNRLISILKMESK